MEKLTRKPSAQPTPGPWRFVENWIGRFAIWTEHETRAHAHEMHESYGDIRHVVCHMGWHGEVDRANARLIAAAPDLLEACVDAHRALMSLSVHAFYGLIPLLRDLQRTHPDFEPESVAGALEILEKGEDGEGYGHPDPVIEKIEAALAKARGEGAS